MKKRKRMLIKIVSAILAVITVVSLTACGNTVKKETQNTAVNGQAAETKTEEVSKEPAKGAVIVKFPTFLIGVNSSAPRWKKFREIRLMLTR